MNPQQEQERDGAETKRASVPAGLLRAWFELTRDEQVAVLLILALLILGIAVRYWHIVHAGG